MVLHLETIPPRLLTDPASRRPGWAVRTIPPHPLERHTIPRKKFEPSCAVCCCGSVLRRPRVRRPRAANLERTYMIRFLTPAVTASAAALWRQVELPATQHAASLEKMAERAAASLRASPGERVSCFESTTGGLIQASLLASPGASAFTTCGAVTYTASRAVGALSSTTRNCCSARTVFHARPQASLVPTRGRLASRSTGTATGAGLRTRPSTWRASRRGWSRWRGGSGSRRDRRGACARMAPAGQPSTMPTSRRASVPFGSPARSSAASSSARRTRGEKTTCGWPPCRRPYLLSRLHGGLL